MFLLDTNLISELRQGKRQASAAVKHWARSQPAHLMYLSSVSVFELHIGVLGMERKDAHQGAALRRWLDGVLDQFSGRVLPFDGEAAAQCAALHVPDRRSLRDSMIAAIAMQHRLILVTRNVKDFAGLDLDIVDPWLADATP